ncbi:MAG: DNA mismatch repair endonuclease MutL [Candidatus Coproplasma sp.]
MGKINILSEELCNRISAGEVIERPFSVVKELVENSLDAGATEIEIEIEKGGKDLIKVTDNGCGIEKDDMRPAFFSHATSKIKELDDISHIRTLGFRGEALATIASVALVEMVSAVEGEEGNKVECDGNYVGKVQPAVASKGTSITVRNLFFNTPVRFKFMKSDKKEESDITAYITRYILGRPDVSFKYYADGQLKLQSYGGGLEEAVTQVYGAKVLPNCFKIEAERNDIKISGFISNQQYFKANKTYQTLFLNGRYVNNQIISSSINNAYAPYMMKKNFPFFVLNVNIPDDYVDVNVHPNKTDVRFSEPSLIYGTIYKTITEILDGTVKATDFVVPDDATYLTENKVETTQTTIEISPLASTFTVDSERELDNAPKAKTPVSAHSYSALYRETENKIDKDFSQVKDIEKYIAQPKPAQKPSLTSGVDMSVYEDYPPADFSRTIEKESLLTPRYGEEVKKYFDLGSGSRLSLTAQARLEAERAREKARQEEIIFRQCKYRGVLFNTYLLYEIKDEVYIIDQHAAHERIIYDRLKKRITERTIARQTMFAPYILPTSVEEEQFLEDNMDALWQIGFRLEPFGYGAFRVTEIPADLKGLDVKKFFEELFSDISGLKAITIADILKDKIAQTACKHAIKGGEELTEKEREELFAMLRGNMGLKCPHGRPICVKLTKTEIEKMFKRKL